MAVRNNSNQRPAYSNFDDDDMASAFMNSTTPSYLAADKMSNSNEYNAVSEAEQRRDELLMKLKQTEDRTMESSKRSVGMLVESEKVGVETAQDLSRQKEQLQNTENRLDDINSTLKDTQKDINGIKSVFSSLKQWWRAPKQGDKKGDTKGESKGKNIPPPSDSSGSAAPMSHHLSSAVGKSESAVGEAPKGPHPAMRLRGMDDEEDGVSGNEFSSDFRDRSRQVNQRLDNDLADMSSGLGRLKDLARGLGSEIKDQNQMLDRIHTKTEHADAGISAQNKQITKILKK